MAEDYGATPSGHPRVNRPEADELNGKAVEFRCLLKNGERSVWVMGKGTFDVIQLPDDLCRIDIVVDQPGRHEYERVNTRLHVPQAGADAIVKAPDGSESDYELRMS
jgi:hypothetical protein